MEKKVLLSVFWIFVAFSNASNYCTNFCYYGKPVVIHQHTVCKYTPEPKCSEFNYTFVSAGLTYAEKYTILKLHNDFRRNLARGEEKRGRPGPQPPAVYIPDLEWNDELAFIAQRWANQSTYKYDNCRQTDDYAVGQNIGKETIVMPPKDRELYELVSLSKIKRIVQKWCDNVKLWNNTKTAKPFRTKNENIKIFTRIAWARTKYIGCGKLVYGIGPDHEQIYLVCNYGPAGNTIGELMYAIPKGYMQPDYFYYNTSCSLPEKAEYVDYEYEQDEGFVTIMYKLNDKTYMEYIPLNMGSNTRYAEILSVDPKPDKNGYRKVSVSWFTHNQVFFLGRR